MCVIMVIEDKRPSEWMIEKAWTRNDDYGGVAWREDGKVHWKKGIITVEEMKELIGQLPLPFVAHFRIASVGSICQELTHPFPIDKRAPLALEGSTSGQLLFHNGDWKGWAEIMRSAVVNSGVPIPKIKLWSDSRAMAWLCAVYGTEFMEFLPEQKGVIFGLDGLDILTGKDGWRKVNDVWCSNDLFMTTPLRAVTQAIAKYCYFPGCTSVNVDTKGYCGTHTDGQKKVESGGTPAPIPFALLRNGLVPLDVAERVFKQNATTGTRVLSKNLLKKMRILHHQLENSTKKAQRDSAYKDLLAISQRLTSKP